MGAAIVKHSLHSIEQVPGGKTAGDVNPAFANVTNEIHLGQRCEVCAACRKPFNAARKPRKEIRLYPVDLPIPIAWAYPLCRCCSRKFGHGGDGRASVLAAVESFHSGEKATQ